MAGLKSILANMSALSQLDMTWNAMSLSPKMTGDPLVRIESTDMHAYIPKRELVLPVERRRLEPEPDS